MALIKQMKKVDRNARVHDEVEASYTVIRKSDEVFIQINTYGSPSRKAKGVVSQTILN